MTLFCLAIGRDPTDLTMAVVNEENFDQCAHFTNGCILGNRDDFMGSYDGSKAHLANLSCRFLSYIDPTFVRPVYIQSLDVALEEVRQGKHWGVMEFRKNYSDCLYDRFFGMAEKFEPPNNDTLNTSDVHVYLDMTNQQVCTLFRVCGK